MSIESIIPYLVKFGPLCLMLMAFFYIVPPLLHHVILRTPPGIISMTYAILTAWTIILGVNLIRSKPFLASIHESANLMFIEGRVKTQESIVVIAIFFSLCFILGNLLRSYFNLHRIEEQSNQDDSFSVLISNLKGSDRWIEFSFRIIIFFMILCIEFKIASINSSLGKNESIYGNTRNFLSEYNQLWNFALAFYIALLLWDYYLLRYMHKTLQNENKATIHRALPAHLCGILVAGSLSLCATLSDYSNTLIHFALFLSIIGVGSLAKSLIGDFSVIKATFRS